MAYDGWEEHAFIYRLRYQQVRVLVLRTTFCTYSGNHHHEDRNLQGACVCVCVVWGRVLQKLWMSSRSTGLQRAGQGSASRQRASSIPLPPSDALPSSETETVSNGRGHAVQASRSAGDSRRQPRPAASSRVVSSGQPGPRDGVGPGRRARCAVRSQSQAASRQVPHWQLGQCGHG